MYKKVEKCRICGNTHLEPVLDLGEQVLTGVFPKDVDGSVTSGPLRLVKCFGDDFCGLLQLEHSYDLSEMYGKNYGYRSGLNASMVRHLHSKVEKILKQISLKTDDLVIDIGSNDSTTLQAYPSEGLNLVGVDPTGIKFKKYYPEHIQLIPDFFSSDLVQKSFPHKKAKVITSFSMFYDLEDPVAFMKQIYEVLADDGIWVFEQSYMPTMLETNSFDTVCHEHLEFYSLRQIKWMADLVGFKIVDVEFNDVNGGSFSITVTKKENPELCEAEVVKNVLEKERLMRLDSLSPYLEFAERVEKIKSDLLCFISQAKAESKTVAALGASTKGNVLLQYCGLRREQILYVAEVNEEKYGCVTPGTEIPIIPEQEMLESPPDYLIVLPWHFRDFFQSQNKYKKSKFVFPLPNLDIVS